MTGYQIFKTDGSLLETINVKTVDNKQATPLTLIGQGIPNYGGIIAEDFVWLLENFANTTPPSNPLGGQHFFNTSTKQMNFFDGLTWNQLVSVVGGVVFLNGLPTSNPHQVGQLWNNSGVL